MTNSFHTTFLRLQDELSKRIVGQKLLIERLVIALLSDGHALLEGVPGLAKTKMITSLCECLGARMSRVQFTPDLLPADLIGTEVFRPQVGDFQIRKGPIFSHLLLADEINRAPAKVQSALLQAMQEREVTIGEQTFALPRPFFVLATQNPLEQEGTYRLPEAQLDRFLMKIRVDYPSFEEEVEIISQSHLNFSGEEPLQSVWPIAEISHARRESESLYVDDKLDRYIVQLVHATRHPEQHGLEGMLDWGASPRASIALKLCSRALAYIRGKDFVSPDEVKAVSHDVLRHRICPSFEAEARGIDSDKLLDTFLASIPLP